MTSTIEPTVFDVSTTLATGDTAPPRPVAAAPAYGVRGRAARWALERIVRQVPVTVRVADGSRFGSGDPAAPSIDVLAPDQFFARLGATPMIGLGEGFMAGDWAPSPGSDLADVLAPFAERVDRLIPPTFYRLRHLVMPRLRDREENTVRGSRENIHRHYDLSN